MLSEMRSIFINTRRLADKNMLFLRLENIQWALKILPKIRSLQNVREFSRVDSFVEILVFLVSTEIFGEALVPIPLVYAKIKSNNYKDYHIIV